MRKLFLCSFLLCLPGLVACAPDTTAELFTASHAGATEVAVVAATASLEAARMRTTLDYSQTRVSLIATQSSFLELTLIARGTPAEAINAYQAQVFADFATVIPSPTPQALDASNTTASGAPTQIVVTPLSITLAPEQDQNAPRLSDIVTATDVDGNDCALGITTTFTTATPSIYVVARATNIQTDTRLASRWSLNGEQVVRYEFTPNFTIEDACIWFFMDQADVTFTPGNWTVQLDINDVPASAPSGFSIRDA